MFAKVIVLCTVVAATAALTPGHLYADGQYSLGAQSEHTVRGFAGLSSVSKQQKAIQGPYSSSQKHDIRVTNDGAYAHPVAAYGHGYAAPAGVAYSHGYAAPAYAAPAYAPALAHGYAAPALHHGYAAPAIAHGYAAPALHHGYAAPALHHGYAAPVAKVAHPGVLGVAYSAVAPGVATAHFSGYGIQYGY